MPLLLNNQLIKVKKVSMILCKLNNKNNNYNLVKQLEIYLEKLIKIYKLKMH